MKNENSVGVSYTYDGKQHTIHVKKSISFMEFLSIVNNIVESSFQDDGKFKASILETVFNYYILNALTDVENVSTLETAWKLTCDSDVISQVNAVSANLVDRIYDAAYKDIEARKNQSKLDELFGACTELVTSAKDKLKKIDTDKAIKAIDLMSKMTPDAEGLAQALSKILSNLK